MFFFSFFCDLSFSSIYLVSVLVRRFRNSLFIFFDIYSSLYALYVGMYVSSLIARRSHLTVIARYLLRPIRLHYQSRQIFRAQKIIGKKSTKCVRCAMRMYFVCIFRANKRDAKMLAFLFNSKYWLFGGAASLSPSLYLWACYIETCKYTVSANESVCFLILNVVPVVLVANQQSRDEKNNGKSA